LSAAQEERFTRKKHEARFPAYAVRFCFDEARFALSDLDYSAFYDKPLLKFERLLETYASFLMLELVNEVWLLLRERKKYWLVPIIVALMLVGSLLVFAQGSAIAPFIYTLF